MYARLRGRSVCLMTVVLAVLLGVAVAYIGTLHHSARLNTVQRDADRENRRRDEMAFRYGQLSREDWELLSVRKSELLDMVGALNYRALMTNWYGMRAEGHYIAQALSDAKARAGGL